MILNIHLNSAYSQPKYDFSKLNNSHLFPLLKEDKLKIIIAPEANSIDDKLISVDVWKEFIDFFSEKNFIVFFVAYNERFSNITNAIYVDLDLDKMIEFGNMCDYFVSLRSGLCDLMSSCSCNKYILYPKLQNQTFSHFGWSSLKLMGLASKGLFEYEFEANQINQILNTIKENIIYEEE